jgi:hypothetical protein
MKKPDQRSQRQAASLPCRVILGSSRSPTPPIAADQAKIEAAAPGTTEIQIEDEVDSPAQTEAEANSAAQPSRSRGREGRGGRMSGRARSPASAPRQAAQHHHDPKIEIFIASDPEKLAARTTSRSASTGSSGRSSATSG